MDISDVSMFRANKGLPNGEEALAQALSAFSRIFGILKKSKLQRGEKSMQHICLAPGFHSLISHTTQNNRFVVLPCLIIPFVDWPSSERVRPFSIGNNFVDLGIALCRDKHSRG